jgi:hypothetical protein
MSSAFTHQILSFAWKGRDLDPQPYPVLQIRRLDDGEQTQIKLEPGFEFNWLLSEKRYCPGYIDFTNATQQICPFKNELESGDMCAYCTKRTGFHSAFFYGDEPNEQMKQYLNQPHYIYLAYFQPGIIKVGTAADRKRYIRLIEQDALVAMYIATATGFQIQDLEHAISGQLGFTEVVKSKQKYTYFNQKPNVEGAAQQIHAAHQQIFNHFQGTAFAEWLLSNTEIIDQTQNPYLYYPQPEQKLHKIYESKFIAGKFLGLRHKYVLLDHNLEIAVLNKRYIAGRYFVASEKSLTYDLPKPIQPSLFD